MFDLTERIVLITGGCGLLGQQHAEAILEFGGEVILTDIISQNDGIKVINNSSEEILDATSEMINNLEDDNITLSFNDSSSPLIATEQSNPDLIYVLMPMRV